MRMNKVEKEIVDFKKQFRIVTPNRWRRCEKCGDFFKDEPMYRVKGWNYGGMGHDYYCTTCYVKEVDKILGEEDE